MKTIEFLDALRERTGSDYATAKRFGIAKQTVSKWRTGTATIGPEHASQVADLLALPKGYVLACMEAERAQQPSVAAEWRRLAELARRHSKELARIAAVMLLGTVMSSVTGPQVADAAGVSLAHSEAQGMQIIRHRRRRATCVTLAHLAALVRRWRLPIALAW